MLYLAHLIIADFSPVVLFEVVKILFLVGVIVGISILPLLRVAAVVRPYCPCAVLVTFKPPVIRQTLKPFFGTAGKHVLDVPVRAVVLAVSRVAAHIVDIVICSGVPVSLNVWDGLSVARVIIERAEVIIPTVRVVIRPAVSVGVDNLILVLIDYIIIVYAHEVLIVHTLKSKKCVA